MGLTPRVHPAIDGPDVRNPDARVAVATSGPSGDDAAVPSAPRSSTVEASAPPHKPSALGRAGRCLLVFRDAHRLVISSDPHATALTVLQFALLTRGQPAAT